MGELTRWLSACSVWALFGIFLAWFAAWSVAVFLVLDGVIARSRQEEMATVAAPLMPAIGTLFAFLTAFVIATEWTQHRDAERNVVLEAGAALRVGLRAGGPASTERPRPGPGGLPGRVAPREWPALVEGRGDEGRGAAGGSSSDRPGAVSRGRSSGARGHRAPAGCRRGRPARAERVQIARSELPPALFVLTFISGVVLNLDAISLTLQHETLLAIVIGGLVLVIALDLALVVAIGAPFRGSLRVDSRPVVDVRDHVAGELVPPG